MEWKCSKFQTSAYLLSDLMRSENRFNKISSRNMSWPILKRMLLTWSHEKFSEPWMHLLYNFIENNTYLKTAEIFVTKRVMMLS